MYNFYKKVFSSAGEAEEPGLVCLLTATANHASHSEEEIPGRKHMPEVPECN